MEEGLKVQPGSPFQKPLGHAEITAAERRSVIAFSTGVIFLTTLPYLLGFGSQGHDWVFSGFVFGVEDGNSYLAKMLRGWGGSWLFRSPYSAYPQSGLLLYMPFTLLGKLTAPPGLHLQLAAVFQIFRMIAGFLLILASYDFIAHFIHSRALRMFGLALVILGGGLGWVPVLAGKYNWLGSLPLDFILPEAFSFLSIYGLPHLAMARALMLWGLLIYLDMFPDLEGFRNQPVSKKQADWVNPAKLATLWLLAGFFNPIALLIPGVIILIHLTGLRLHWLRTGYPSLDWGKTMKRIAGAAFLPGIFLIYHTCIAIWDPFARSWSVQNQLPSPNGLHFLVAYGLVLPYVLIGAFRLVRKNLIFGWLLLGWVLAVPVLAYAPISIQRRLIEGVWVALAILAVAAFDRSKLDLIFPLRKQIIWLFFPLGFSFLTTAILLSGGVNASLRPERPLFIPSDQAAVFQDLQLQDEMGSVVLTSLETGNIFPAFAPIYVLVGHGPESIHQTDLLPEVEHFYQSETSDSDRIEFISRFDIDYIFWGPAERSLGNWNPGEASFLKQYAHKGNYSIYKVIQYYP